MLNKNIQSAIIKFVYFLNERLFFPELDFLIEIFLFRRGDDIEGDDVGRLLDNIFSSSFTSFAILAAFNSFLRSFTS